MAPLGTISYDFQLLPTFNRGSDLYVVVYYLFVGATIIIYWCTQLRAHFFWCTITKSIDSFEANGFDQNLHDSHCTLVQSKCTQLQAIQSVSAGSWDDDRRPYRRKNILKEQLAQTTERVELPQLRNTPKRAAHRGCSFLLFSLMLAIGRFVNVIRIGVRSPPMEDAVIQNIRTYDNSYGAVTQYG